jgi:hypothetical protein
LLKRVFATPREVIERATQLSKAYVPTQQAPVNK